MRFVVEASNTRIQRKPLRVDHILRDLYVGVVETASACDTAGVNSRCIHQCFVMVASVSGIPALIKHRHRLLVNVYLAAEVVQIDIV
jgi:hypothetical protein